MTCRINDPEQATEIKEDEKPKRIRINIEDYEVILIFAAYH